MNFVYFYRLNDILKCNAYKIRTATSKERMKQMNTYGFTKKIALVGTGFVGMSLHTLCFAKVFAMSLC